MRKIIFLSLTFAAFFLISLAAYADTYTVCDSGCNFTTIQGAIDDSGTGNGDTVQVITDDQDLSDADITIDKEITLECQTGRTITDVDQIIITADNVTVDNCIIDYSGTCNASVDNDPVIYLVDADDFTITDNTINDYARAIDSTYVDNSYTITGNTINNNCGDQGIRVDGTGTISGNYIEYTADEFGAIDLNPNPTAGGTITITNNTINSEAPDTYQTRGIYIHNTSRNVSVTISGNDFYVGSGKNLSQAIFLGNLGSNSGGKTVTVQNNTFLDVDKGVYSNSSALENVSILHNSFYANDNQAMHFYGPITLDGITIKYNVIEGTGSNEGVYFEPTTGSISNVTNDYNAYWGVSSGYEFYGDGQSMGSNSVNTVDPAFTDAVNNDFTLLPFSYMIGLADDNSDLGAEDYSGSRRTTIYVDDDGVIDYSTVDFNDIGSVFDYLAPSGDTVQVAAGTYAEAVSITGKTMTLTGAGAGSTTINASGNNYGLQLNNVDSGSFSGFTISGANYSDVLIENDSDGNSFSGLILSNLSGGSYFESTRHPYSYSGNDYDNNTAAQTGIDFCYNDSGVGANDFQDVSINNDDISTAMNYTASNGNWNLALVSGGGGYYTFYVDDDVTTIDTQSEFQTYLTTNFGAFTVDFWEDDVLVYSGDDAGGEYTYNAPTGPTLITSYQSSPAAPMVSDSSAVIRIHDSDGTNISGTTISNNDTGIFFSGNSNNNTVNSSVTFSSNTLDLYHTSSGDNLVDGNSSNYDYQDLGTGTLNFTSSVAEFSTYMYMITVLLGFGFIYRKFFFESQGVIIK